MKRGVVRSNKMELPFFFLFALLGKICVPSKLFSLIQDVYSKQNAVIKYGKTELFKATVQIT